MLASMYAIMASRLSNDVPFPFHFHFHTALVTKQTLKKECTHGK